jgi:STAS domain
LFLTGVDVPGHSMHTKAFPLPEVVDLNSARSVAADLLQHIDGSAEPVVSSTGVRQAGVPLLQILVAARRRAEDLGKTFTVKADPDGTLARLLTTYALDPILCGAPADLLPPMPEHRAKRT